MAPRKIVKARKQIVWEIAKSGIPPSAKHTSLKYYAEQEKGDNIMTWQELAKFNWKTEDPDTINMFLHDIVGCKHLTEDKHNWLFWGDETQESYCEKHKKREKGGTGYIWIPEKYIVEYNTDGTYSLTVESFKQKEYIPSRCIVNFRPNRDWGGEYGFDWLREGDTGYKGDLKYEGHIGSYGITYATEPGAIFTPDNILFQTFKNLIFDPVTIQWKKTPAGNVFYSPCAWLSIFPKDQTLTEGNNKGERNRKKNKAYIFLFYEILDEVPDSLTIKYNKEYFSLNREEISPKNVGKYEKSNPMEIAVECLKEFNEDQTIYVEVETRETDGRIKRYVAGQMKVCKNNKTNRHKINIVIIQVKTNINGGTHNIGKPSPDILDKTERHFYQSLTSINKDWKFNQETLDLRNNNYFKATYTILDLGITKVISNPNSKPSLHEYLNSSFESSFKNNKIIYPFKDFYKVFVFNEEGGYLTNHIFKKAGGQSSGIPSNNKCVTIFKDHLMDVIPHELYHAIGLYHTFDNNAPFVAEIYHTNNVMDYNQSGPVSWKYQWDLIHSNLEKE
jgi:hypothetical protein